MAAEYRQSYRLYPAWNYEKEIEDLNLASEQGWQLVRGGFHSRFLKNADLRYRYQMDFRKVEDMGRYLETFREQGWEYISSTFNGWHYFRKLYDPALPEEAYEIFTDRESLQEMSGRWARLALRLGALAWVFALVCAVWMVLQPHLPTLIQMLVLAIEGAVLLRGWSIMRNSDSSRSHRGDSRLFAAFLAAAVLGSATIITLTELRPHFSADQRTDSVSEPLAGSRWTSFQAHYPDYYYIDLQIEADAPLTFEILDGDGKAVYAETGKDIKKENTRIWLARGQYWLSLTCDTGFRVYCSVD